ncbi:glutamate--tRNA ligase family protein [Litorivicinus lipolyticus]|uniref:glutamate--tRNA ligase family protein n=1 Tax=Litorivicinus lipolyticus TaxID=418701 RepID=UPI003B5A93C8
MPAGRFAPSPTGRLHAGSLLTATAAWLHARQRNHTFWLRIDDIDPLRDDPESKASFAPVLAAHGLCWDGDIQFQSRRTDLYRDALGRLQTFVCACSRKLIAERGGVHGQDCQSAPGTHATRLTPCWADCYTDGCRGDQAMTWLDAPVLWRRDNQPAYHLACAVDEIELGITSVIRGDDLLEATSIHRTLIQQLGTTPPEYAHLAVLRNPEGQKLSKQNMATPIDPAAWHANLCAALGHLIPGHTPEGATAEAILDNALHHFRLDPLK